MVKPSKVSLPVIVIYSPLTEGLFDTLSDAIEPNEIALKANVAAINVDFS